MKRTCGDCQLCCKLVPVKGLGKPAGVRCKHQKYGKGCMVYHRPGMPPECAIWTCRWLVNDDTADLPRPDRSHYVIDLIPDYITVVNDDTGEKQNVEVVQVWVDPKYPDAHHDPALRAYMRRRGDEGKATIVRFDNKVATVVFPPQLSHDHQWHDVTTGLTRPEASLDEVAAALGGELNVNVVAEE